MQTKIVLHADELSRLPELFGNLANLVKYQTQHPTDQITVTVVLNGDAIMAYLMPSVTEKVATYLQAKMTIEFHACNNSLSSHGIAATQLPTGVIVVPAGVLDLALLQDHGFRYIKP